MGFVQSLYAPTPAVTSVLCEEAPGWAQIASDVKVTCASSWPGTDLGFKLEGSHPGPALRPGQSRMVGCLPAFLPAPEGERFRELQSGPPLEECSWVLFLPDRTAQCRPSVTIISCLAKLSGRFLRSASGVDLAVVFLLLLMYCFFFCSYMQCLWVIWTRGSLGVLYVYIPYIPVSGPWYKLFVFCSNGSQHLSHG